MSTFSDFVRLTVQRKCPFGWSLADRHATGDRHAATDRKAGGDRRAGGDRYA